MAEVKFVVAKKPEAVPAVLLRRNKLVKAIWEQMEAAKAQAQGKTYAPLVTKRKVGEDGLRHTIEVPKRIRPWHWTGADGKTYLSLRYGTRELRFEKDANAVLVPKPEDLLPTLSALRAMAEAGEFDAAITAVSKPPTLSFPERS